MGARQPVRARGGIYAPLGNGEYVYYGERPGAGWHGHGYCEKKALKGESIRNEITYTRISARKEYWEQLYGNAGSSKTGVRCVRPAEVEEPADGGVK